MGTFKPPRGVKSVKAPNHKSNPVQAQGNPSCSGGLGITQLVKGGMRLKWRGPQNLVRQRKLLATPTQRQGAEDHATTGNS